MFVVTDIQTRDNK